MSYKLFNLISFIPSFFFFFLRSWSYRLRPKKRCQQLLSGFLAKGHLPLVSRQSRRSLMISVIMKWSWGCAQISWHLPYSWGKPQKTSTRRPSDEGAVRPVIASNGLPFLQMRSVGSHSTSGREKEGKKERVGYIITIMFFHVQVKLMDAGRLQSW